MHHSDISNYDGSNSSALTEALIHPLLDNFLSILPRLGFSLT